MEACTFASMKYPDFVLWHYYCSESKSTIYFETVHYKFMFYLVMENEAIAITNRGKLAQLIVIRLL